MDSFLDSMGAIHILSMTWYPRRDSLRLARDSLTNHALAQGKLTGQVFDLRSESFLRGTEDAPPSLFSLVPNFEPGHNLFSCRNIGRMSKFR